MEHRDFELTSDYVPSGDQPDAITQLTQGLEDGLAYQTLLGVTGSGKTFSVANVIQNVQRPTIIMAPNKVLAAQLYGEMKAFFPDAAVEYFVSYYDYYQPEAYVPTSDTYIEKDASINEHIEQMRLSATKALFERSDTVIVATVSAIYGLGDPRKYMSMVIHLDRGDRIEQRALFKRLVELQYTRNDMELKRGTFRSRGEAVDIYPADSNKDAVRVEFFDDEIENIQYFDPLTGEVLRTIPRVTIFPKTHYVMPRATVLEAVENIKEELVDRLKTLKKQSKLVEAQRLEQRTNYDLEMMREIGYCMGIENYSRYFSGRKPGEPPHCLLDYLPSNALMVIDESHIAIPQFGAMYEGDHSRKKTLVEHGFRLPSALDNRPLMFKEFTALLPQTIFISATPREYELKASGAVVEQVVRPTGLVDPKVEIRKANSQVDDILSEINACSARGERVLITTMTKRMAEDMTSYLHEQNIRARYMHSDIDTVERVEIIRDLRSGEIDVLVGINLLREGLDLPEVSLVAVFDADKEGFLRSDISLIQTIGRAARHINGTAILYADEITGSMQRAIDETSRRRAKQEAYNRSNKITPKSIRKKVADIMEGAYSTSPKQGGRRKMQKVAEDTQVYTPKQGAQEIRKLETKMYRYADELEFELAAQMRDRIREIKERTF